MIISHVQKHDVLGRDYLNLSRGRAPSSSSRIRSLNPFLDSNGLMRVRGRTGNHQILLPHNHQISVLIARHYHCISHSGMEWSTALIREKFWILKCRRIVQRVIQKCVTCKRLFAEPSYQKMSDLPAARITPNLPPFTHVGIDAFGPFEVSQRRSSVKRYGCIFTCMVTRAIHIEVLCSLDTSSFLNAFSRFVARRGNVQRVFSDNGRNFVSAEKELKSAYLRSMKEALRPFALSKGIDWSFNPPLAPHMGGAWERMIGVTKKVLRSILSKGSVVRLTDEILHTVFCEAEAIVNGRPLTRLSDDPNDLSPLTPNHLLLLRQSELMPGGGSDSDAYRKRWKYIQHLSNCFWSRFVREYLPALQKRSKWIHPQHNMRIGELILVVEKGVPRGLWPLGRVTKVNTGRDGLTRSVEVKTRTSTFCRPVTGLVRLECDLI